MKSVAIFVLLVGAFSAHALDEEDADVLNQIRHEETGDVVAIRGDNGKYLSRINHGWGKDCEKKQILDRFSKFCLRQIGSSQVIPSRYKLTMASISVE